MARTKARTIFIWEGPDTIAITRGPPFETYQGEDSESLVKTKVRFAGFFPKWYPVINIDKLDISQPKKVIKNDKILNNWQAIKIGFDFMSRQSYNPSRNPNTIAEIRALTNELMMYKRLYVEERQKNMDRAGKDRLQARMKSDAKHMGEVRSLALTANEKGFASGFGDRWGLGGGEGGA